MADLHLLLLMHALRDGRPDGSGYTDDTTEEAPDVHLLLEFLQTSLHDTAQGGEPAPPAAQPADSTVVNLLRMLLESNQGPESGAHSPVMHAHQLAPPPVAAAPPQPTPPAQQTQSPPQEPTRPSKRSKPMLPAEQAKVCSYKPPANGKTARTSQYKGVSRHRLTKRWEASVWSKGRQIYLGGFDTEASAAKAYDIASLVLKGGSGTVNFEQQQYTDVLAELQGVSQEEVVAYIRRQSSAFARGSCRYRGVSKNQHGRWESRIGHFQGRKNVNLGSFDNQEEAAQQYDRALVIENGVSAKTNFPMSLYVQEMAAFDKWAHAEFGHLDPEEALEFTHKCILPMQADGSFTQHVSDDAAWRRGMIFAKDLHQALNRKRTAPVPRAGTATPGS